MAVQIEIVGILKDYVKTSPDEIAPPKGQTVAALIEQIGLPSDLVAFVIVNGRQEAKTYTLKNGDHLKLLPFVGGG